MTSTDRDLDPQRPTVRPTRQRRAVAAALAGFDDFRSAQEIHDLITEQGDSVGLAGGSSDEGPVIEHQRH